MSYELLMGLEQSKAFDEAIQQWMWFEKNPILDQPKQKWHRGDGFYRVVLPFNELMVGDIILLQGYTHNRVVKIATPTEKQVFFNYDRNFNADMQFTPEEWLKIIPLTKRELFKILPHMSTYIKDNSGYSEIMRFYPENLCADCKKLLHLEIKKGWESWLGGGNKRCNNCGKSPIVTTRRNALKPIGK